MNPLSLGVAVALLPHGQLGRVDALRTTWCGGGVKVTRDDGTRTMWLQRTACCPALPSILAARPGLTDAHTAAVRAARAEVRAAKAEVRAAKAVLP